MRIDHTALGEITIDGKTYDHDVIIGLSGEIVKRKRNCRRSCMVPRTLYRRTRQNSFLKRGCRQLILGSGQEGNVRLSPEAGAFFAKKDCEVVIEPTPRAIRAFNEAHGRKIGLFHVTC
jgi:hypothetical protein